MVYLILWGAKGKKIKGFVAAQKLTEQEQSFRIFFSLPEVVTSLALCNLNIPRSRTPRIRGQIGRLDNKVFILAVYVISALTVLGLFGR